jgi:hypothetical protein
VRVYDKEGERLIGQPRTNFTPGGTITSLTSDTNYRVSVQAIAATVNNSSNKDKEKDRNKPIQYTNSEESKKVIVKTAVAAAPAFTLSPSSKTVTVNTVVTGFTINSTGGAIASFGIDATPPGMSFDTTTGALTGTPNTVAPATTYTVTATNATGTATQIFTLTVTATCANGGPCIVGDRGPGGGKIFYVAATPFTCGPTLAETCTYLEAAPTSGINAWTEAIYVWSETNAGIGATAQGVEIGTGFKNTLAMIGQNSAGASGAGNVAQAFRGPNNLTDWFLPSKNELNQLYLRKADSTVEGFLNYYYWSSTEADANYAWSQGFINGYNYNNRPKLYSYYVRPVRAF